MSEASTTQLQGWLLKLQAGDPAARNEVITRSLERLRRLVRKTLASFGRVRRFEDTDDVLQGLLIRLMRRLESARPPTVADFLRLAASEVRHALIDLTRRYCGPCGAGVHEMQHVAPPADESGYTPEPGGSTYDGAQLSDWEEFHRQVQRLPAEEGDVFAMLWYNDLTKEEVAAALGISLATVKRRWLAARLHLQKWIEGEPGLV